ncbi:MAG: hypothetical protein U5Q44_01195 [Dehalococcoidia bacterium]|nr:hypothetical protein [Dehalococcoidia bacterium]
MEQPDREDAVDRGSPWSRAVLVAGLTACGDDDSADDGEGDTLPAEGESPENGDAGGNGAFDASGMDELNMTADSFFFEPATVRGKPIALTVVVEMSQARRHRFQQSTSRTWTRTSKRASR